MELAFEFFDRSRRAEIEELAAAEAAGPFRTLATASGDGPLIRSIDPQGDVAIGSVRRQGPRIEEGFGEERRQLLLFGAGHVGRALMLALAPLPFEVLWVDPRPDAFPALVPANVRCMETSDPTAVLAAAREGTFVLVMTHNHSLDLAIVDAALRARDIAYVGVIGSASKRVRFRRLLGEAGLSHSDTDRMVMPIGIPGIRSKLPAAIAASVASDLLIRDESARDAAAKPAAKIRASRGS